MGSSCHSPVTYVPISHHLYLLVLSLFPAHIYLHLPIFTSVIFASHWQWLRYAFHLLISSLLTYCTSLGTYCPLSSFCQYVPLSHHLLPSACFLCLILSSLSPSTLVSSIFIPYLHRPYFSYSVHSLRPIPDHYHTPHLYKYTKYKLL